MKQVIQIIRNTAAIIIVAIMTAAIVSLFMFAILTLLGAGGV